MTAFVHQILPHSSLQCSGSHYAASPFSSSFTSRQFRLSSSLSSSSSSSSSSTSSLRNEDNTRITAVLAPQRKPSTILPVGTSSGTGSNNSQGKVVKGLAFSIDESGSRFHEVEVPAENVDGLSTEFTAAVQEQAQKSQIKYKREATAQRTLLDTLEQPKPPRLSTSQMAKQTNTLEKNQPASFKNPSKAESELPLYYDPELIARYWDARPWQVRKRWLEVTSTAIPVIISFLVDGKVGLKEKNARKRAQALRQCLTKLGPTFIKLGQGLSVRPDLVGPAIMEELQQLCDKVPSFPNEIAMRMIEEDLGMPPSEIFSEISPEPVAAASLGQVYKAKLRSNGQYVAVKVQRPDMLEKCSLDLYLLRQIATSAQFAQDTFTANKSDFTSLLDQWSKGMFQELDYINEANNSVRFSELIKPLNDVYVPSVYFEYTSRKVLVMEWLDGRKLADSDPSEINRLVGLGVNCFLMQLLDTGFFHADPHPGNLMTTSDGRLAVLDFGLMSEMEKPQMDAMIASIIHLANRDYIRVVDDFVDLDFLPPDVDKAAVVPVLAAILDQALQGGGAKSVNFQSLSKELSQITFDFPFKIPPYFALIIRALGVLEGIALTGDPEFKMIMQAYPYVAKRIVTDRSPALREAFYQILYKDGSFNPTRLQVLLDSAQGYVADGDAFVDFDTVSSQGSSTKEAVRFLFSEDGSFIREILADEIAKGLDVAARSVAVQVQNTIPAPLRNLPFVAIPRVSLSKEEIIYVENMKAIFRYLLERDSNVTPAMIMELMPEVLPKAPNFGRQVAGRLGEKVMQRFFDEILGSGPVLVPSRSRGALAPSAFKRSMK